MSAIAGDGSRLRSGWAPIETLSARDLEAPGAPITFVSPDESMRIQLEAPPWFLEGGAPPPWFLATAEALRKIMALPDGWDSYGARRVESEVLNVALELLLLVAQRTLPAPTVVPTVRGGVQLEWHAPPMDLEIEVLPPSTIGVLAVDHERGTEEEFRVPVGGSPRLVALIRRLTPRRS